MRTAPASGVSRPARIRSRVVLPQPEGPSRVTNSPGATSSETSRTAATSRNDLRTPRSETAPRPMPTRLYSGPRGVGPARPLELRTHAPGQGQPVHPEVAAQRPERVGECGGAVSLEREMADTRRAVSEPGRGQEPPRRNEGGRGQTAQHERGAGEMARARAGPAVLRDVEGPELLEAPEPWGHAVPSAAGMVTRDDYDWRGGPPHDIRPAPRSPRLCSLHGHGDDAPAAPGRSAALARRPPGRLSVHPDRPRGGDAQRRRLGGARGGGSAAAHHRRPAVRFPPPLEPRRPPPGLHLQP